MKSLITILLFLLSAVSALAQSKYFTKSGKISFFSRSSMENIEAVNNKVVSVLDIATGQLEFAVLMKGFEFDRALMQEHFNEDYVESDKYPKAIFKGSVENSKAISLTTDNVATVKVSGTLTIHGVTNPITATAVIAVKNTVVAASCSFTITLADYKIIVPAIVAEKINKKIAVVVTIPAYQVMAAK